MKSTQIVGAGNAGPIPARVPTGGNPVEQPAAAPDQEDQFKGQVQPTGIASAQAVTSATAGNAAGAPAPPTPLMHQAQVVVAATHGGIDRIANAPMGEAEVQQVLAIIDAATAQLQSISAQASTQGDTGTVTFIAGEVSDLTSARGKYVALGGDIGKDDQTVEQTDQQDDAAANQNLTQGEQEVAGGVGPAINDITVGNDEGDDSTFGDEDPPDAPPTADPPMPAFAPPPGPESMPTPGTAPAPQAQTPAKS